MSACEGIGLSAVSGVSEKPITQLAGKVQLQAWRANYVQSKP